MNIRVELDGGRLLHHHEVDVHARALQLVVVGKAASEPRRLIEKRDAMRKDELWDAVVASGRSYDDILAMVRASGGDE